AHIEVLDFPANPASVGGQDAKAAVLAQMRDWYPALRWLVQTADASTATAFAVKTSEPIQPWATQRGTLLADALHNMAPFRGIGANTALRDAMALRRALVAASRGEADLIKALAAYEQDMIGYGFTAVQASLRNMERFHARGVLARSATKAILR